MTEAELEDLLSTPRPETVAALAACPGDVVILGAGGKMGPTLAMMAKRAAGDSRRVIAVSRWSNDGHEKKLNAAGVETIRADLLDRDAVATLPDAPNVIFMVGQKFGTNAAPAMTWAMNTIVPANCAERYQTSRIVAFSTGNVYPLTPVASGGSRETDPLGPVGEYAASCVGRERIFELYAERHQTKIAILRLNYAIDLRYGVLVDIARRVLTGEPISLQMGYLNVIWQGDANARALQCLQLAASPATVLNVTGIEKVRVRWLAERFGARFARVPVFAGEEAPDALLSNATRSVRAFGLPAVDLETMIDWTASWLESGGRTLGKPTNFEERRGRF